MILKTYKIIKLTLQGVYNSTTTGSTIPTIKDINGNNVTKIFNWSKDEMSSIAGKSILNRLLWYNLFYKIGTGTTEPTVDDYALETDATSSFSNIQAQIALNNVGEDYAGELIAQISGQNNTPDPITISEVGVGKNMYTNDANTAANILFIRHLLDTPLTVQPNETFKITLTWTED